MRALIDDKKKRPPTFKRGQSRWGKKSAVKTTRFTSAYIAHGVSPSHDAEKKKKHPPRKKKGRQASLEKPPNGEFDPEWKRTGNVVYFSKGKGMMSLKERTGSPGSHAKGTEERGRRL